LLAEQDAAERELRRAREGRRATLEAKLVDLWEAQGPLGRAEMKASLRLAKTVPASLTGVASALRYVRERCDIGQYPMYEEDGYRLLLFSTECAICASARSRRFAPWSVISNNSARSGTSRSGGGPERAAPPWPPASSTKRGGRHYRFCAADLAAPAAVSRAPRSRA
jgi:hypothetical protein